MNKVIITGANGFVGSKTVKYFLEKNIEVLAIDRAKIPQRLENHHLLKYLCLDLESYEDILHFINKNEYDTFIHFAWAGSAGSGRFDYHLQMRNAIVCVEVMKVAKELGCKKFIGAGSIMEREVQAVIETQGSKPSLGYIYGIGKYTAHCLCKAIANDIGIEVVWALITNAYGEGELSPRFVNTTLRKIIQREPLKFTSATQNYDFVYVDDVARAFYLISENGKPFCEYIIGSGQAKPLKEFILEMQHSIAPTSRVLFGDIPFTGVNIPLSAFDDKSTYDDCKFKAEINFAEGTARTLKWLNKIEE